MKNRLVRWVIFLLIGVGIGAAWKYSTNQELSGGVIALSPDDQNTTASVIKRPSRKNDNAVESAVGGPFELVDHTGKTVTQDDYADAYKLVFFGFTYCPAICPTELQKVTLILDTLEQETADKITPIFISVDPERDTVEQVSQYVEQFHPRLVGLTGTQEQIDAVTKSYKVFATKVENEMMEEYMMDHSAFLYLMDHDNKMVAMYPSTDTADDIAKDIQDRNL